MADDSTYGVLVSFVVTWPVASLIISTTVVAFRTNNQCLDEGITLEEHHSTEDIIKYNEVDCKVMWDIIRYLRIHHIK